MITASDALAIQTISKALFTQTTSKTVANTTSETTLLNTGVGTITLTANQLIVGKTLRITGLGYHSAVSNPSITIKIKIGGIIILTTGAVVSANSTNAFFEIRCYITCRSVGISGTVQAEGFYLEGGAGANNFPMVNTSTVTIDTTISNAIDVTAQWSAANAANTITSANFIIETLN